MKRFVITVSCCLLAALFTQPVSADIMNGQYVPDELVGQAGTQYRLVFITSGAIDGSHTSASYYDTFVTNQVAGTALEGSIYNWKAVVSTISNDRLASSVVSDAGYTIDPGMPYAGVYNTGGIQVALSGTAMLDDGNPATPFSLLAPVRFDQNGVDKGIPLVWTGSNASGGIGTFGPGYPAALGASTGGTVTIVGDGISTSESWLRASAVQRFPSIGFETIELTFPVYAVSDILIVPVPEPSTCVLWVLFCAVGGVVFWQKRRGCRT